MSEDIDMTAFAKEAAAKMGGTFSEGADGTPTITVTGLPLSRARNVSDDRLRLLVERIERLLEEKKGLSDDIRDVYGEAKATGYDAPTIRECIKLRAMDKQKRDEREALLETYQLSLGL